MYPKHNNKDGSFQELAHASDVKFGQLSYLTVNPQCIRGGHYHTRKEEWFCCVRGKCTMVLADVKTKKKRVVSLNSSKKKFVYVKPYEKHTVLNLGGSEPAELLVIISEEYDESNPDTFKGGINGEA